MKGRLSIAPDKNLSKCIYVHSHIATAQRYVLPVFFRWIYYYGSNKSTGLETVKSHLCALQISCVLKVIVRTGLIIPLCPIDSLPQNGLKYFLQNNFSFCVPHFKVQAF